MRRCGHYWGSFFLPMFSAYVMKWCMHYWPWWSFFLLMWWSDVCITGPGEVSFCSHIWGIWPLLGNLLPAHILEGYGHYWGSFFVLTYWRDMAITGEASLCSHIGGIWPLLGTLLRAHVVRICLSFPTAPWHVTVAYNMQTDIVTGHIVWRALLYYVMLSLLQYIWM